MKIVLTCRYECGQIGWQVVGSTGNVDAFSSVCGLPVMSMISAGFWSIPGMFWPASSRLAFRSSGES